MCFLLVRFIIFCGLYLLLWSPSVFAQNQTSDTTTHSSSDSLSVHCSFLKNGLNRAYIFYPADFDSTKTYPLTIFLHGYNGVQPEIYGGWINSLVQEGSVVLFPVYQNSQVDLPAFFFNHAVEEIHAAFIAFKQPNYPKVDTSKAVYIGHSLGGNLVMKLINHWDEHGLPKPYAALLAQSGSGVLSIEEEKSYDRLPKEILLLCFSGKSDGIVGASFTKKVMKRTTVLKASNKYRFTILNDKNGKQKLKADHLVPCSYLDIIPEKSHLIANSAAAICETNILDTAIYWEASSILLRMMKEGRTAVSFATEINGLLDVGKWSDGSEMKVLERVK